jgi:hypothetical protein
MANFAMALCHVLIKNMVLLLPLPGYCCGGGGGSGVKSN